MAIGDAVAAFMGTAITNRQPSAGVEEQVTALIKPEGTDAMSIYNGTTAHSWYDGGVQTNHGQGSSAATRNGPFNMAVMITNSIYIRKLGTSNQMYVGGVQTNS